MFFVSNSMANENKNRKGDVLYVQVFGFLSCV